jgi:hypothetical protein
MIGHMTDLLLIAVLFAFFGVALLFVKACERIVGPDTETERLEVEESGERGELAA